MEAENFNMKRTRKSNRVSWAPGLTLYQVKLFLSEDCPSKVGHKLQDHLQAKASWMLQSNTIDSHDIPPGFEGKHLQYRSKEEVSLIPRMKWRCPPRFMLSGNWHVAAGEESEEKDVQKLREMRVLEAVYPRHSSIPPSPSVSMEVQDKHFDDNAVPIIPIMPIEEEESMDVNSVVEAKVTSPVTVQPELFAQNKEATVARSAISNAAPRRESGVSSDLNADVVASASAALAAILKCNEQDNMIDTDLLIKILTDQKMSERLIAEHARVASAKMSPMCSLKPSAQSLPLSGATIDAHKPISRNSASMPPCNPIPNSATPIDVNRHVNHNAVSGGLPASNQEPRSVVLSSAPKLDMNRLMNQNAVSSSTMNSMPATREVPPPIGRPDWNINMQNCHQVPQRVVNLQPPTSGAKRVASVAFPAYCAELNPALPPSGNGNLHLVANPVRPGMNSLPNIPPNTGPNPSAMNGNGIEKNANYYKKLIREHGMDKQERMKAALCKYPQSNIQDLKMVHRMRAGGVKPKCQKPCIYFNSPKGCRNGINCLYVHDAGIQLPSGSVGMEGAKRLRP